MASRKILRHMVPSNGSVPIRPLSAFRLPLSPFVSAAQRHNSNQAQPAPDEKAQSLLSRVPEAANVTKTAFLSAGAGLSIFLVGNEFYVFNEETVVLLCTLGVFTGIFKFLGPQYKEWANGAIQRQKDILDSAKQDHVTAVETRLQSVKDLGGVIEITKSLFQLSKETARLEAEAYELEQKTVIANEARSVLESWVRYEGQVKQKQQKDLTESVIAKIDKELENPKVLQQLLNQSLLDVERIFSTPLSRR